MRINNLINKYLNKNHKICFYDRFYGNDFVVVDIINGRTFIRKEFIVLFKTIFSNNKNFVYLAEQWFETEQNKLKENMIIYLEKMDLDVGSVELEKNLVKVFENNTYRTEDTLKYFDEYYHNKVLSIKIEKFVEKINVSCSRANMINLVESALINESDRQKKNFISICNKWYDENIVMPKVNLILRKCRLNLGERNWELYYNNELTDINIITNLVVTEFNAENSEESSKANALVSKWYENKKIEHTELEIKNDFKFKFL